MTIKYLQMKKLYFLLFALSLFTTTKAQIVDIPDANFKKQLLLTNELIPIALNSLGQSIRIDSNFDGQIQTYEVSYVSQLNLSLINYSVQNLEGIQNFLNLTDLNCSNNPITSINLGSLTNLIKLNCSFISQFDLNFNLLTNLTELKIAGLQLSSVNSFSSLTSLRILDINPLGVII